MTKRYAWYVLLILTAVNFINYVDRQIIISPVHSSAVICSSRILILMADHGVHARSLADLPPFGAFRPLGTS
jgi:hypothetical protein